MIAPHTRSAILALRSSLSPSVICSSSICALRFIISSASTLVDAAVSPVARLGSLPPSAAALFQDPHPAIAARDQERARPGQSSDLRQVHAAHAHPHGQQ